MPISPNQRLKLPYLMKILLEQTDEQNPMSASSLIEQLRACGVSVERKTLYADIELLRLFKLDIETARGKSVGYFIASRRFELPELKLLVDAVQSSRFITEKKSAELIAKLSALTSEAQAKQLSRQVYVAGRAKTMNEAVYYSIDAIHAAIGEGKKITFKYFDYSATKQRVYRKNGELYQASPIALCWNDDSYYLIAYSEKHACPVHYRVDRMSGVTVLDDVADDFDRSGFNVAEHVRQVFGMFGGELVRAALSFDNSLVSVVLDHFGKDVVMKDTKDGRFEIRADVSVSPVFLGWMFQFGGRAEIKGPDSLICAMRELIEAQARLYAVQG